jgi:hypothetical protein
MLLVPLTVHQAIAAPLYATVSQYGPNPIVFDQTSTTDNIQYLMAEGSEHPSTLTMYNSDFPKSWWFTNFGANSSDYLKWYISVPSAANYRVLAVLQDSAGAGYRLTESSGATLNFTIPISDWDKHNAGVIALPAGTSNLTLIRTSTGGHNIKSLELIRDSDYAAYNSRVAAARANTAWFSQAGYGLMFQEGAWSYPRSGSKRDINTQANGFDVNAFVNMVKSTGASYVIWSFSWYTYQPYAPITSVNTAIGSSNPYGEANTSTRDLIGELATALHAQGIKFMMYYHRGEPASALPWFQSSVWDPNFSTTGVATRTTFFNDWDSVVTEVGNRYGTNLDGWFFDDGMVYYPAKFEHLEQVARAGNASRLVAWNPWIGPRVTDFQDVWMGENHHSETITGSSTNGTGILTAGPNKGELEHGMFAMGSDWGVHNQNQTTGAPGFTAQTAANWVCAGKAKGEPESFDMMMWDGGTQPDVDSSELNLLVSMKGLVASQCPSGPTPTPGPTATPAPEAPYGGTRWNLPGTVEAENYDTGGQNVGYFKPTAGTSGYVYRSDANKQIETTTDTGGGTDVGWTNTNDWYKYMVNVTSAGTYSINVRAASTSATSTYHVEVDGTDVTGTMTVPNTGGWQTYQTLTKTGVSLSAGAHTLRLYINNGGMNFNWLSVSGGGPTPTPGGSTMINDNAGGFTYSGAWSYQGGRGAGDYQDDVHYTSTNNDFFQYTFTGTGVDFIAPKGSGYAVVTVYIDGVNKGNFSEDNGGAYAPQQVIYRITGLSSGSHTIKVVKVSGSYHQIDALKIYP